MSHSWRSSRRTHLHAGCRLPHAHPAHPVRRFAAAFAGPPHHGLTGRRPRLGCTPIAEFAVAVGCHDETHRHLTTLVGTAPGRITAAR